MAFPKRQVEIRCAVCGKTKSISLSHYNKSKTKKFYCDPACSAAGSVKTVEAECAECGKTVKASQERLESGRVFCSIQCCAEAQRKDKVEVRCPQCGTAKLVHPCRAGSNVFCNSECYAEWRSENVKGEMNPCWKPKITVRCAWCGASMDVFPCKSGQSNFCGKACRSAWRSNRYSGEGNPNWNDGTSIEPYGPGFGEVLKRNVRERDGNECVVCGQAEGDLHVHHIDYDKDNLDPWNLITLCNSCHSKSNFGRENWKRRLQLLKVQRLSREGVHHKPTVVEARSTLVIG